MAPPSPPPLMESVLRLASGGLVTSLAGAKALVRFLAHHSGLPALLVAAVLVAIGYRVLKRSLRFAVEIAAITTALVAATELGWIRW